MLSNLGESESDDEKSEKEKEFEEKDEEEEDEENENEDVRKTENSTSVDDLISVSKEIQDSTLLQPRAASLSQTQHGDDLNQRYTRVEKTGRGSIRFQDFLLGTVL